MLIGAATSALTFSAYRDNNYLVVVGPPGAHYDNVEIVTEPPALFIKEGENIWKGKTPARSGVFTATLCQGDACMFVEESFHVSGASIFYTLSLAFIVGVIMNFMPCVLPVIGLKLVALAKDYNKYLYVAGVLSSFLLLATLSVLLGTGLSHMSSWSFRFLMVLVCVAMGSHLLGVWKLPAIGLGSWGSRAGPFGMGILTVALGSSCSVPFLAPVLVYLSSAGVLEAYALFLAMGLGFASPFLVPFKPWLPKPGAWMVWMERGCGVAMLLIGFWLCSTIIPTGSKDVKIPQDGPRIIVVSAEWCINCQIVETIWNDPEVEAAIIENGFRYVSLDWTNGDKAVTQFLSSHDHPSVPFALIENADGEVTILSGIYTKQQVIDCLYHEPQEMP